MRLNLEEYNAIAIDGYKNIFVAEDKYAKLTHVFTIVNKLIFRISRKNCLDREKFIKDCLLMFEVVNIQNINSVKFRKISQVKTILDFSSLILIPYEYFNHDPVSKEVLKKTMAVAPIYECEFSGDEDKEELQAMISGTRATVHLDDWEREVSPKLKMSYANFTTQSGSRSKAFKIADSRNLHWAVSVLKDSVSYVGFENFRHEKYKVALSDGNPFLTPAVRHYEKDFHKMIDDILLGKIDYPKQVPLVEKINVDAVEASSKALVRLVDNCLNEIVLRSCHPDKVKRKKNTYMLLYEDRQEVDALSYSLIPSDFYKDNGCSITMHIEIHVSRCNVASILNEISLPCNDDYLVFNESIEDDKKIPLLKFRIAHGIYSDIISNASFVISVIKKLSNIVKVKTLKS